MKYLPLNKFPQFDENPFLQKGFEQNNPFAKFVIVKGNEILINQIIYNNGVQFELTKVSKQILIYILTKCIIPDRFTFYIDYDEALLVTNYKGKNMIRNGLSQLMQQNVIARSGNSFKFYLNPKVLKK